MYNTNSSPTVTNCIFSANANTQVLTTGGGMDNENDSSPIIIDCIFTANQTFEAGGGLSTGSGCDPLLINCAFIGNVAHGAIGEGGGMSNFGGSPVLINCTFTQNTGNSSGDGGGAVYNSSGTMVLTNCILYGDSAPDGEYVNQGTLQITYSDVQGGFYAAGDISSNPFFASSTDLELKSGSPCIDAGSNAAVPANITTDLAGNPRIVNGVVDMGAYEFQPYLWYGLGDGVNWNNAANWAGGQVPNADSAVIIPAGVTVRLGSGTSTVDSLILQGNGSLDLGSGTLLIAYGSGTDPISSIQGYLANGYNNGGWNGAGIFSSVVAGENAGQSALIYSVGYADGADGIVSGLSSGQIEIMPTLAGDAMLAGAVSFGDFQLLSQYFGSSGSWDEGNFTYGSVVDFGDFQLLSQNFGQTSALATADPANEANLSKLPSAVPTETGISPEGVALTGFAAENSLFDETADVLDSRTAPLL
jgi:hypothetical protein